MENIVLMIHVVLAFLIIILVLLKLFLFSSISLINEVTVVSDEEDFIILGINSLDQIKELFKYVETNDSEINSIEINEDLKLLLNYMN